MRRLAPVAAFAALALLGGCHEQPSPLTPDLTVEFQCAQTPSPDAIASFMGSHGFAAADTESSRRKRGKAFFPLQVDGIDQRHKIFEVIGLKEPPSYGHAVHYRLTILSPPPTSHDPKLESAAQDFLETALGCRIASIANGTNKDASTRQFDLVYDEVLRRLNRDGIKAP
jgi:hypothetical protein